MRLSDYCGYGQLFEQCREKVFIALLCAHGNNKFSNLVNTRLLLSHRKRISGDLYIGSGGGAVLRGSASRDTFSRLVPPCGSSFLCVAQIRFLVDSM